MAWPNAAVDWREEMKEQDENITEEELEAMLEQSPIREFVGFQGQQMDIAHFDLDVYNSKFAYASHNSDACQLQAREY